MTLQFDRPPKVTFAFTETCNQECRHCYADCRRKGKRRELSTDEWLKLIDYLAENGVIQTYIEGGEPLIRQDLEQIIEAFAKGTPVVVSKLGAMAEIVDDGHTGLFFKPGDPADLAAKVRSIIANPLKLKCMRQAARRIFDQNFTADANHKILMKIYEGAMRSGSRPELQN